MSNDNPSAANSSGADEASFDSLPLSDEVRQALKDMGYEHPTPVQLAVYEPATAGRDVVVQARTGTGKTTGFGLPIIDRLLRPSTPKVQALVLCPTRELALQVCRELSKLGANKGITPVAIYGGTPIDRQVKAIADGAQLVIGTPGRVLDHMRRGTLDASTIRTLVLDEADEMLSMGFERELSAIIEQLPEQRQTLLFSATLPPDTERMAKNKLRDPEFIVLSSDQVGALEIDHFVYWVQQDKADALVQVLEVENPESAIVFCNTRDATLRTAERLKKEGYEAAWLNGDLPQNEREKVMTATREGRLRLLVATDVAARGIDISHLTHVINFDFPNAAESYVHRTGRTGRAGRTGTAISLITPQEIGSLYMLRLIYKIKPLERQLPSAREQQTRMEADVVLSLISTFAPRGNNEEHLALARRLLSHDDAEATLAGILRSHLSTNPDEPEVAKSRRRGRVPPPQMPAAPKTGASRRVTRSAPEGETGEASTSRRRRRKTTDSAGARGAKASQPGDERKAVHAEEVAASHSSRKQSAANESAVSTSAASASAASTSAASPAPAKSAPQERAKAPASAPSTPPVAAGGAAAAADGDEPVLAKLHVNSGRRDGARVRGFKTILSEGGISPEQVGRIRIRDRYSFIEVDPGATVAALELLNKAEIGERALEAKLSTHVSDAS